MVVLKQPNFNKVYSIIYATLQTLLRLVNYFVMLTHQSGTGAACHK